MNPRRRESGFEISFFSYKIPCINSGSLKLGAFCRHCDCTIESANCVHNIQTGFAFTTNAADIIALYDQLTGFDDTVDIKKLYPNSKRRKGLTHRPLDDGTLELNKKLPVLHSYINLLNWFEQAGYHHNARLLTKDGQIPRRGQGIKKTDDENDALAEAKLWFQLQAKYEELNMALDAPDPTGNGGNCGKFKVFFTK